MECDGVMELFEFHTDSFRNALREHIPTQISVLVVDARCISVWFLRYTVSLF